MADDDHVFLKLTTALLSAEGYEIICADNVVTAGDLLRREHFDIMMLDMCFPALHDGFGMLDKVHLSYPTLPVLMISGSSNIPDAVLAIKNGAVDFIEKPLDSNYLFLRLKRLSDNIRITDQMHSLQLTAIGMKGNSASMQTVYQEIIKASEYSCPVLITGETGVGKELAAHAIHRLSKLNTQSMVTINCASIPKDLFESELFGYERGAFTGAQNPHKGYFEFADRTSFFLDEISELPLEVQAKLLRVVSEGEVQKVGGTISKINTRIISASNQDLFLAAAEGKFRKDLLYRLNTIHIQIPPLRSHLDDIPVLAEYLISQFCSRSEITPIPISADAISWLCEQPWPGNVRELKNTLERAVIFTKNDELGVVDFTTAKLDPTTLKSQSYREVVQAFEKAYLEKAIKANHCSISKTAKSLNMDKSNLAKKISSLGINITTT